MGNVKPLSDDQFDSLVLQAPRPVMVDMTAEWCGPCRMLEPIIDQFAEEHAGEVDVYRMDIGENPNTPARLGVLSIPMIILFSGGQEVGRIVGAVPKDRLEALLDKAKAQGG